MDTYKETFETWDKLAKLYQDKFMDLDLYDDSYDLFCECVIKINPSILEIGCGPGNITKYLLNKRPDFNIEAIDISPNMIALAKINNPTANFKLMDIRNINQLKTKFDAIICGFCLPYISKLDCSKLINNLNSLLTEHGVIYLSFVEGDNTKSAYQIGSSGDRIYFYYHSLDYLQSDLQENKFEIIKVFHKEYEKNDKTSEIHSIILAEKYNNS